MPARLAWVQQLVVLTDDEWDTLDYALDLVRNGQKPSDDPRLAEKLRFIQGQIQQQTTGGIREP